MPLPRRQDKGDRLTVALGAKVDLGAEATLTATERFRLGLQVKADVVAAQIRRLEAPTHPPVIPLEIR